MGRVGFGNGAKVSGKKLGEECAEYCESREAAELADVIEVVRGILYHRGMTWDELERIRAGKYEKRGGFEGGIRLKAVDGDEYGAETLSVVRI